MWISGQQDNHELQQQPQQQCDAGENDKPAIGNIYEETPSKPGLMYADIETDPQASSHTVDNVNVFYTELNGHLYANVEH